MTKRKVKKKNVKDFDDRTEREGYRADSPQSNRDERWFLQLTEESAVASS